MKLFIASYNEDYYNNAVYSQAVIFYITVKTN